MASSREYLEYLLEQLSVLEGITYRAMMGEYILYCQGKIIGGVYDNRFLVKSTSAARRLMPNSPLEPPYEGAKEMLLVREVKNREFLTQLVTTIIQDLPAPKKKKRV